MNQKEAIQRFQKFYQKLQAYRYAMSLISFDDATEGPKKAYLERGRNASILAGEYFKLYTSSEYENYLQNLEKFADKLDDKWQRIVYLCRKDLDLMKKIPPDEYEAFSLLQAESQHHWEIAKEKADYSLFQPYLEKIISFVKKFGHYYGLTDGEVYNTYLDQYEEGIRIPDLDNFFATLKETLVPLLQKIQQSKVQIRRDFLTRKISKSRQLKAGNYILKTIGFDLSRGLLKESAHPFTNGLLVQDTRVTTHIYENNFLSSLFSCAHEGGHGIYDQNLNPKFADTPLRSGASMAMHESQSRFFENIIGRSEAFVDLVYPRLQKILGLKDVTKDEFYRAINIVTPSLIRTEADELTYCLHIMVRYELEKMIMRDQITVAELPAKWNELYHQYLGITPSNDREGILQDIHWSGGAIGYFFSYALGNAYSGQILHAMQQDLDIDSLIRNNKIKDIRRWLYDNIYQHGSLYPPKTLIKRLAKEEFNPRYYCDYLKNKYEKIYQIDEPHHFTSK